MNSPVLANEKEFGDPLPLFLFFYIYLAALVVFLQNLDM